MQEVFEKIIEKLEEERECAYADFDEYVKECSPCLDVEYDNYFHRGLERAIRVIKEMAKEHNNGWIPVRERLPENTEEVLVTDGFCTYLDLWNKKVREFEMNTDIIAWQPLPEPYQPKGE